MTTTHTKHNGKLYALSPEEQRVIDKHWDTGFGYEQSKKRLFAMAFLMGRSEGLREGAQGIEAKNAQPEGRAFVADSPVAVISDAPKEEQE